MMDEKGRVWFTARIRPRPEPGISARRARTIRRPRSCRLRSRRASSRCTIRRPAKWSLIDTCFTTQHLYFAHDANNTLWTSAGGPQSGVVGWLNTKMYAETGDEAKSQGWTPIIVDTNGNGKRDAYVEANEPLDPTKDKRVMAAFYGVQPSPVDDSIWGQSMDCRLLAHGSARLHHPPRSRTEPVRDRAGRNVSCRPTRVTARAASTSISTAWSGRCSRAAPARASTAVNARGRSTARRP